MERIQCVNCHSDNTYVDGGTKCEATNNHFAVNCQDCKHIDYLAESEALKYAEIEYKEILELLGDEPITVEKINLLLDKGYDTQVYYNEEWSEGFDYDKATIEHANIYCTWICVTAYGDDSGAWFQLLEC